MAKTSGSLGSISFKQLLISSFNTFKPAVIDTVCYKIHIVVSMPPIYTASLLSHVAYYVPILWSNLLSAVSRSSGAALVNYVPFLK